MDDYMTKVEKSVPAWFYSLSTFQEKTPKLKRCLTKGTS